MNKNSLYFIRPLFVKYNLIFEPKVGTKNRLRLKRIFLRPQKLWGIDLLQRSFFHEIQDDGYCCMTLINIT